MSRDRSSDVAFLVKNGMSFREASDLSDAELDQALKGMRSLTKEEPKPLITYKAIGIGAVVLTIAYYLFMEAAINHGYPHLSVAANSGNPYIAVQANAQLHALRVTVWTWWFYGAIAYLFLANVARWLEKQLKMPSVDASGSDPSPG